MWVIKKYIKILFNLYSLYKNWIILGFCLQLCRWCGHYFLSPYSHPPTHLCFAWWLGRQILLSFEVSGNENNTLLLLSPACWHVSNCFTGTTSIITSILPLWRTEPSKQQVGSDGIQWARRRSWKNPKPPCPGPGLLPLICTAWVAPCLSAQVAEVKRSVIISPISKLGVILPLHIVLLQEQHDER